MKKIKIILNGLGVATVCVFLVLLAGIFFKTFVRWNVLMESQGVWNVELFYLLAYIFFGVLFFYCVIEFSDDKPDGRKICDSCGDKINFNDDCLHVISDAGQFDFCEMCKGNKEIITNINKNAKN